MEIAKFILTAVGTFLSVFGLSFTVFQYWRKKQDEKFELLKRSLENIIQKEIDNRKEAVTHIEGRISSIENTMSQRFENRLSVIEGELRSFKPILLSIQNWFINNPKR
ncbi:MAG: hypothetical protein LBC99_01890 [Spirochaetota bacterium]|nr:hypothetical protein [Spirochaetota bacterium]